MMRFTYFGAANMNCFSNGALHDFVFGFFRRMKRLLLDSCRILFTRDYLFQVRSYSQDGEDIFLKDYFSKRKSGFFVDVGAHHPYRFSTTFHLYRSGWNGINIDGTPGVMKVFRKYRPRDINIEAAVSLEKGAGEFYCFSESALNGFLTEEQLEERKRSGFEPFAIKEVEYYPLREILEKNVPNNTKICYMNIDVEGLEYEVLESNDWEKFKPELISVELIARSVEEAMSHRVSLFLNELGYRMIYKNLRTAIFEYNAE